MRPDINTATRPILWNVEAPINQFLLYSLFAISLVVMGWGLWRRFELWSAGRPDRIRLSKFPLRFLLLVKDVLFQQRTNRDAKAKVLHSLILWGFIALMFATSMVMLEHDFGFPVFRGKFYLAVSLLADVFGLALMMGLMLAFHRRYIQNPDKLHSSKADSAMILLMIALCLQGFLLEGIRIAVTNDPWAAYTPVGYVFQYVVWGQSNTVAKALHFGLWWTHAVTVFLFFALIPYSKFFHIIASTANLYFQNIDRPKGALSSPGDLEQIMEEALESEDGEFSIGVSTVKDLTWKQRLNLDACTSCGRCQSVCPAYRSGKILSPKWLILDSRNHMLSLQSKGAFDAESSSPLVAGFRGPLDTADRSLLSNFLEESSLVDDSDDSNLVMHRADNELVNEKALLSCGEDVDSMLAGEVLDEDVFWSCTTCGACMEACPVGIEHVDYIVDVRRSQALMHGNIPAEAQPTLRAIETRGNPFGPAEDRIAWAEGLDVNLLEEGDEVDVLYWTGCISAFDKRKQKIARSMVEILNASGVSWGMLGNKECCTGDPARRLGEENLFQTQAKTNITTLSSVKFAKIVTNCPHCLNSFKNEYPEFGQISADENYEIIHHSQFIAQLQEDNLLNLDDVEMGDVTYHDPCYLGRYNDTYDEPRDVLVQLGSGRKLKEMKDSREQGLCCGAGGGHFWFDMKVGDRVNVQRVDQAAETGSKMIATSCPFCLQMMEDGVKLTDREEALIVKDIAELVAERIIK